MQVRTAQVHIEHRTTVVILGVVIGVLALSYVMLVHRTVRNVVERRTLETENRTLSSRASEMEFSYMQQKNEITPEQALSSGFSEAQKVTYIPRTQAAAVLTLNR